MDYASRRRWFLVAILSQVVAIVITVMMVPVIQDATGTGLFRWLSSVSYEILDVEVVAKRSHFQAATAFGYLLAIAFAMIFGVGCFFCSNDARKPVTDYLKSMNVTSKTLLLIVLVSVVVQPYLLDSTVPEWNVAHSLQIAVASDRGYASMFMVFVYLSHSLAYGFVFCWVRSIFGGVK